MSAILKEDPPELTETNRNISPALERIVRHCLEKNPAERFQSARDVAFNLGVADGRFDLQPGRRTRDSRRAIKTPLAMAFARWLARASFMGSDLLSRSSRSAFQSHFSRSHVP